MVRVIRSVLLVTLVLGIGAATAQGRVGTPQRVSPAGLAVHESAVAAGGSRIAVLMAGSGDLEARLGGAGGFGRTQRLDGSSFAAHVAVGADGTAVAVWTASAHAKVALRVAIARPGHDFGRARTLSHAASHALGDAVAVTTSGRAVVAWIGGTNGHSVQVAVAAPGRPFGAPQTLGDSRQYAPVVGVAPNGTAIVAGSTTPFPLPPPAPPPPSYGRVLAVALAAGATAFGPATELGRLTTFYLGPGGRERLGGAVVSCVRLTAPRSSSPGYRRTTASNPLFPC